VSGCGIGKADTVNTELEDWQRPYRAANGHTMAQTEPGRSWNVQCVDDCDACNGTGPYAEEPWYSDGML